jgi:signal transduction histidine kinase
MSNSSPHQRPPKSGAVIVPPPLSDPPTSEEVRRFIMAMVHSLRNKLNSARGYTELVGDLLGNTEAILDRDECADMTKVAARNIDAALGVCDVYLEQATKLGS